MPSVALDKATLVAEGLSSSWGMRSLKEFHAACHSLGGEYRRGKYPYDTAYSLPDGGYLATARDGAAVPRFRLEFNPAHELEETASIARLFEDARLTRVDYAVDYDGVDLNDYIYERPGVKREEIRGRSGRLETLYLGRKSSAVMLRVYDKAKEAGLDSDRLRTEAQCRYRPDGALDPGVFDRLTVRPRVWSADCDLRTEQRVVWALNTPGWEQRVRDTRARRRLTEVLNAHVGVLEPQPCDVLRERWSEVADAAGELTGRVSGGKVWL